MISDNFLEIASATKLSEEIKMGEILKTVVGMKQKRMIDLSQDLSFCVKIRFEFIFGYSYFIYSFQGKKN